MTFVVMGLGTVFNALTNRRDPTSGLSAPILKAAAISLVPLTMIVLATELPGLQKGLLTTSLTGREWLACLALAAAAAADHRGRQVDPPAARRHDARARRAAGGQPEPRAHRHRAVRSGHSSRSGPLH